MKPLKPKEQEFISRLLTNNGNRALSVKQVFGIKNNNHASVKGLRLVRKGNVKQALDHAQESLKSALIKQGITPEKVASKIGLLLEHTDPTVVDKGVKHAKDIYGIHDHGNSELSTNNTYNFLFNPEVQAEVKAIEEKIKEKLLSRPK